MKLSDRESAGLNCGGVESGEQGEEGRGQGSKGECVKGLSEVLLEEEKQRNLVMFS